MKTKKNPVTKCLSPVRIEPGTSDSKSNSLLSELTWHLLVTLRLKTETLGSLYSHAILILTKPSKFENSNGA